MDRVADDEAARRELGGIDQSLIDEAMAEARGVGTPPSPNGAREHRERRFWIRNAKNLGRRLTSHFGRRATPTPTVTEPYNPDADSYIVPISDADAKARIDTAIQSIEVTRAAHNGRPLTFTEIAKITDSTIDEDEAKAQSESRIQQLAEDLIAAKASPQGPMLSSLRSTLNGEDFDKLADLLYKGLDSNKVRSDLTPAERKFYDEWTEYRITAPDGTTVGIENPVLTREFQEQLTNEVEAATGVRLTTQERANLLVRINNSAFLNTEFMGKKIKDHLMIMGGAFAARTVARIAIQSLAGPGGYLVIAGAGAAAGATRGIMQERIRQRENPEVLTQSIGRESGETPEIEAEKARRVLREGLASLSRGKKTRLVLAATQGALMGGVGAMVGVELSDLLAPHAAEIFAWAKDHVPSISKPDWVDRLPFIGSSRPPVGVEAPGIDGATPDTPGPTGVPSGSDHLTPSGASGEPADLNKTETGGGQPAPKPADGSPIRDSGTSPVPSPRPDTSLDLSDKADKFGPDTNISHISSTPDTSLDLSDKADKFGVDTNINHIASSDMIPPEVSLHPGSNPWDETRTILKTAFGQQEPSNEQILKITKLIAKDSGIRAPEWGLPNGTDQHLLRPGFKLILSDETKKAIAEMAKSR